MIVISVIVLLLLLLLLENMQHLFARVNLPAEGQSALPINKPYKFMILSMMSCLKMISWQQSK